MVTAESDNNKIEEMAQSLTMSNTIKHPEEFDFTNSADWPRWIRRFNLFREVTNLDAAPGKKQVASLLYHMGETAQEIYDSFKFEAVDQDDYNKVVERFEGKFIAKRNVIYKRATFYNRQQHEGESMDEYVTALHIAAKYCEFRELYDEFIRDKIVNGIRDRKLAEKLQLRSDLTLGMAVELTKQHEQVRVQTKKLNEAAQPNINKIDTRKTKKSEFWKKKTEDMYKRNSDKKKSEKEYKDFSKTCGRCGGEFHPYKECPAAKVDCYKCKKLGHYAKVCRSTATVRQVDNEDEAFIVTVSAIGQYGRWDVTARINEQDITFKADTGAAITCISEITYLDYFSDVKLLKPKKRLLNASRNEMRTLGFFRKFIQYK